jgi:transcriptional regulator with XRE-family HTH domain
MVNYMVKQFDEKLGETMRRFRETKGITLLQVAEMMNVTKVSVHYWETGKRQINASALKEYCAAIGVKVQQLFDAMEEGETE